MAREGELFEWVVPDLGLYRVTYNQKWAKRIFTEIQFIHFGVSYSPVQFDHLITLEDILHLARLQFLGDVKKNRRAHYDIQQTEIPPRHIRNRDSSVSKEISLWAGQPRIPDSISGRSKGAYFLHNDQIGSGVHPTSYTMDIRAASLGLSWQGVKLATDLHLVPRLGMVELFLHLPDIFMSQYLIT
jgi:hypothetical protein